MIPYFIFVVVIASTGVIGEMSFGRAARSGPIDAFGMVCEKMPPFTNVGRHDHFRFQAVGKNRTGFLRCASFRQHSKSANFHPFTGIPPIVIGSGTGFKEARFNHRDFLTELALAVITIAGGFLTVRSTWLGSHLSLCASKDSY